MLRNGDLERLSKVSRWLLIVCFMVGYLVGHVLTQSVAAPDPNALKVQGPDTIGNLLPIQQIPPGPSLTVFKADTASSANAAAANNVTLPASATLTTFITGFEVTGAGATAASVITVTLTNTVSGTLNYQMAIPAGAAVGVTPLIVEFSVPIPATGINTAITLNVPSFGAGNTNAAATIHGFRQ